MNNIWKQLALHAYYAATRPARRRAARKRVADGTEPVQVLFYHRVADEHPNAWTMGTRRFARQIDWIRRRYDIVDLTEAQRRIASGDNRRPTVAITFDDGYADNCQFAIPFLLKHNVPFTYFVSTEHVFEQKEFAHDLEAGQPLRPNTVDELRAMAAAGVEIGSHTRTHVDLGAPMDDAELCDELASSKWELEEEISTEIRYFAFPFGFADNMTSDAFRIALESGYQGVCSAYGAYNFAGDDPFHIRRIHGDPEMIRLKNWLTVDPRKLHCRLAFDPGDYRTPRLAPGSAAG